jgi:hypothetical protein
MKNSRLSSIRLIPVLLFTSIMIGCSKGDYLGPVERAARAVTGKWDMWDMPSIRPYEAPMLQTPPDVLSTQPLESYATARLRFDSQDESVRTQLADQSFKRYCIHCHGENLDGRTIIGESLTPKIVDLRHRLIQAKSDEDLYKFVMNGSKLQIPLRDTVTPFEAIATIAFVRNHARSSSYPLFQPKNTKKIE